MYQNHGDDKMVIVFSLAPWRENKRIFKVSLNLFFFSYIAILIHITMSSLYRYALLCNKNLRRMFEKRLRIMLGIIFLFCFSVYYLDALSEILADDVLLSKEIMKTIHKMYNADLTRIGVVGNTIENLSTQPLSGKMGLIVVLGIGFMFISACCGYAIHLTLQGTAISPKTKEAHSKALNLLLAQFALPVIFLHIPTFTFECYSLLIQDKIPMFVRVYIRIFLTYYPVANAAFLTDDFRNYILSLSGGEWKVVSVITPLPIIVSPIPTVWLQTLNDLLDHDVIISEDAINTVQREYKVDLTSVPTVTNQPLMTKVLFILLIGVLFNSISGWCRAISSKAKRAHLKALRLLLVQFALPFFFLYLPTIVIESFALFLQTNIPMFCKIYILILFSCYPVASASCVLFLTDDFRLFILSSGECLVVNVVVIPPPIINSFDYPPDRNTTRSL
ncbi:hypothetical protein PRIPAC_74188 [Pristionchus pacificus]|uniref:G protein-coupled receptor n=1 Tax=Pristionchus pacificus TaxID=54126 RepID=A0A2A6CAP1_PRIPA|nr:hypothetical protein PRIPAC_74188 [Pristionchus pacificus]|eukprot:PDM75138.1 G protein-coupled receptor [Pristionchus pacificus]